MPTPLIDKDEALWAACGRLAEDPQWTARMLGDDDALRPVLLAYGPVARRNQYQAMLYARARAHGFWPLPIQKLPLFGKVPSVGPVACHLHWVHELTARAPDEAAADAGVEQWTRLVARIKANGHAIVWTVHNVLPHESSWPDHDVAVHRLVAGAADVVHVMTAASRALCAPHYGWAPEKELLVPHPSYERAQTDWLARADARAMLGLPDEAFVLLSFGAVLRYKGFERVMRLMDRLAAEVGRPLRWLVAGQASDADLVQQLRAWAAMRSDTLLDIRPVPNEDLQEYFRAADAALCPYERTLNSGAALMAVSFGLPVIGPRTGGFVDNLGDACAHLYTPGDDDSLVAAVRSAAAEPPG